MAVSTALRQRYRLGEVPQLATGNFRLLSDAVDVVDNPIPVYVRIVPGDRIENLSDSFQELDIGFSRTLSESFAVADSLRIEKSNSPTRLESIDATDLLQQHITRQDQLTDSLLLTDDAIINVTRGDTYTIYSKTIIDSIEFSESIAAFTVPPKITTEAFIVINDVVIVNAIQTSNVVLADVFDVSDAFQKSITRTFVSTIYSKTVKDVIDVVDSANATFLGINQRTLSDSVVIIDDDLPIELRKRFDVLDANDARIVLRLINKKLRFIIDGDEGDPDALDIAVTDDILVGRTSINNQQADLSTIAVSDFAFATFESGQPVSSPIEHGIEVF